MRTEVSLRLLAFVLVMGLAAAIAAPLGAAQSSAVTIDTTAIVETTLTIEGKNFGAGTPAVTVGGKVATITRSSDTEIVAEIAPLAPGFYRLSVVRDSNEGGTAVSTLMIR
jgi:IPT/TIG domain